MKNQITDLFLYNNAGLGGYYQNDRGKLRNINWYTIIFKTLPLLLFIAGIILLVFNAELANADSAAGANNGTNSNEPIKLGEVTSSSISNLLNYEQKELKRINGKFTQKHIFKSTQSEAFVGKKKIENAIETGGGVAQALAMAPGIQVTGYGGNSGLGKNGVMVRGIKVGAYANTVGTIRNGITVSLDGIPMNNLIGYDTGWNSATLPIANFLSGINVIYGPGNPESRWFDSLGGTINFIPVQPTANMSDTAYASIGSFNSYTLFDKMSTGFFNNGWDAVLAAGYTHADSFLQPENGATMPNYAYSFYGKLIKTFNGNSFILGAYASRYEGYLPSNSASNSTAGFYSTSPFTYLNETRLRVQTTMLYSKLNLKISDNTALHSQVWYRHGYREHYYLNDGGLNTNPGSYELYTPNSDTIGEKIYLDYKSYNNDLKIGESDIWQRYNDGWITGETTAANPTAIFSPLTNSYLRVLFYNNFLASFIQDKIDLFNNRLTVTPGVDYVANATDFNNTTASYYLIAPGNDNAATNQEYGMPDISKQLYGIEPSVGANFKVNKYTSIYGNYAITYQNPDDISFGAFLDSPVNVNEIAFIKNTDFEAGLRFLIKNNGILHNFVFNGNYYQSLLTNEPQATWNPFQGGVYNFGIGSTLDRGVIIDAEEDPMYNLHLFFNGTFFSSGTYKSLNIGGVSYNNYNAPFVPKTMFNAGGQYRIPAGDNAYLIKLWDTYTGSQYIENSKTGGPSNQTMDSYNILNGSIGFKTKEFNSFVPGLKATNLTFSIFNLLGKEYISTEHTALVPGVAPVTYFYPGAPREFFLSASMMF
ncbi:MAG: TonB-dependent receptor [bacterium]